MSSQSPLRFDLNNLFSPAILDGAADLAGFEKSFHEIHVGIQALRKTGQLAFSHLPSDEPAFSKTNLLAKKHRGVRNIVVLGIGGSALGAKSIYHALNGPFAALKKDGVRLFVLDNIEAAVMEDLVGLISDEDNLFVCISKSGNTSETLAQYLFCKKHFPKFNRDNVIVITGPKDGTLLELAHEESYATLDIPEGVGGRFSVFTPVGLFPLSVAGVDIESLLHGAAFAQTHCEDGVLARNPAGLLALTLDFWSRKNLTQLAVMPYSDRLLFFADWAAQLFAESLNKKTTLTGKPPAYGLTVLKTLGVTDQHSQLQLYLDGPRDKVTWMIRCLEPERGSLAKANGEMGFLSEGNLSQLLDAERSATAECLRENNRPNATITLNGITAFQLGQLYQTCMNVVPYLGALLNINPYDQPAVERIKKFTFGLMGRKGFEDFAGLIKTDTLKKDFVF